MKGKEYQGQSAEELIALGYRRVSNKFLSVSRIDRPDWEYILAKQHSPWDVFAGLRWVRSIRGSENTYRRCTSEDVIDGVPIDVFKQIPLSNWETVAYVPIPGKDLALEVKLAWNEGLREEARLLARCVKDLELSTVPPCSDCRRDGFACDGCAEAFYGMFEKR